jgi:hypothetical protein
MLKLPGSQLCLQTWHSVIENFKFIVSHTTFETNNIKNERMVVNGTVVAYFKALP